MSGHDGFSVSGRRVLVNSDGARLCAAGEARVAKSGDIGGLVMARSRRRLGRGWNFLLKEGSREGALELSASAGVTGGESEKDNQLSRVLLGGNGKGIGLSSDDVLGGMLRPSPEEGLRLTSTTLALAGASIVAQARLSPASSKYSLVS